MLWTCLHACKCIVIVLHDVSWHPLLQYDYHISMKTEIASHVTSTYTKASYEASSSIDLQTCISKTVL